VATNSWEKAGSIIEVNEDALHALEMVEMQSTPHDSAAGTPAAIFAATATSEVKKGNERVMDAFNASKTWEADYAKLAMRVKGLERQLETGQKETFRLLHLLLEGNMRPDR
jgi:hypothetical protein